MRLANFTAQAWVGRAPCRDGCAFAPEVDGVHLPDWPMAMARRAAAGVNSVAGAAAGPSAMGPVIALGRVPLLHGSTLDDGYAFVKQSNFFNLTNNGSAAACAGYREAAWGACAGGSTTERLYPRARLADVVPPNRFATNNTNNDTVCFVQSERMETDFAYACPARQVSHLAAQAAATSAAAAAAAPVFRYVFALHTPNGADREFVPHGHDLPLLFQRDDDPSMAFTTSRSLARLLLVYWTNFAAHGDPNPGGHRVAAGTAGQPTRAQAGMMEPLFWPRVSAASTGAEAILLDRNITVVRGWKDGECDFWDEQWDTLGRCSLTELGYPE